jgi:hypothetical protein
MADSVEVRFGMWVGDRIENQRRWIKGWGLWAGSLIAFAMPSLGDFPAFRCGLLVQAGCTAGHGEPGSRLGPRTSDSLHQLA